MVSLFGFQLSSILIFLFVRVRHESVLEQRYIHLKEKIAVCMITCEKEPFNRNYYRNSRLKFFTRPSRPNANNSRRRNHPLSMLSIATLIPSETSARIHERQGKCDKAEPLYQRALVQKSQHHFHKFNYYFSYYEQVDLFNGAV